MSDIVLDNANTEYWNERIKETVAEMWKSVRDHGMTRREAELTAIICDLIFHFAQQTVDYAVYLKDSRFKKATRETRRLIKSWEAIKQQALNGSHMAELEANITNFLCDESVLISQLYLNIKQEIDKDMPEDNVSDLRAMAWRTAMMVDAMNVWLNSLDTIYHVGNTNILWELKDAMKSYVGYDVKNTMKIDNMNLCVTLLMKAVTNIEIIGG